ncbi:hypothetical protein H8959_019702 [Pygathrix nigripes]
MEVRGHSERTGQSREKRSKRGNAVIIRADFCFSGQILPLLVIWARSPSASGRTSRLTESAPPPLSVWRAPQGARRRRPLDFPAARRGAHTVNPPRLLFGRKALGVLEAPRCSHLAGLRCLRVYPTFFVSSFTFEKPRFRFWSQRPRRPRRGDGGASGRPVAARTAPHPPLLHRGSPEDLLPRSVSFGETVRRPGPGREEAWPPGDALRAAREERPAGRRGLELWGQEEETKDGRLVLPDAGGGAPTAHPGLGNFLEEVALRLSSGEYTMEKVEEKWASRQRKEHVPEDETSSVTC